MNKHYRTESRLRQGWLAITLLASLGVMAGCGGGGKSPAPAPVVDAVPTGYYGNTGTATVLAGSGNTPVPITDLQGMIYNGRLIMLSTAQGLSYDGTITVSGNSYSGSVTAYRDGTLLTTAPVNGTISQGASVTGTLTGMGAGSGTFTLNYAANNSETAALAVVGNLVTNVWAGRIGGSTTNFQMFIDAGAGSILEDAITNNGVFAGCGMAGFIVPVNGTHLYTVSITLSSCNDTPAANGTYTGLATTRTQVPAVPNDRLVFVVTNGTFSPSNEFTTN